MKQYFFVMIIIQHFPFYIDFSCKIPLYFGQKNKVLKTACGRAVSL